MLIRLQIKNNKCCIIFYFLMGPKWQNLIVGSYGWESNVDIWLPNENIFFFFFIRLEDNSHFLYISNEND